jgi:glycosidase
MNHKFLIPASCLLFSLFLFIACNKDDNPITPEPPDPDPGPQQYGIPFDNVPAIADIQMYEVNPRVFSATKNIDGITARLDSLKALGINVVWLMPIYPTGQERSVGSPYAIKNYTAIHADYGNLTDLRQLVDKAHALDMAVMLDWVANHTAWDHEWIKKKAWYTQDGNGSIIHPPGTNWQDVADLNFSNTEMRLEMIKAMKYWVLEANIDGYRCDYATGVPTDFWQQAIDTLRAIPNRDLIMFAESESKPLLSAGFDIIFGWPFYGQLKNVFSGQPASTLHTKHLEEYTGLSTNQHILRWTTNHDQHAWEATPQTTFGGADAAMAAFIIASHMGGIPLIYNGQEVDVPNQLPFFEGQNVTINWSINPTTKSTYTQVLNFRESSTALRHGTLTDQSSANICVFTRKSDTEEVLVLVNVRDTPQTYTFSPVLANTSWTDAYTQSTVEFGATVEMGEYEFKVLKK